MASQSQTPNGSSGPPPDDRPLEEILVEYNQRLDDLRSHSVAFETTLQEHQRIITRLAETYRDPIDVGTTIQELEVNERPILADWHTVLSMQDHHSTMTASLSDAQISMIRFWSTLDRRESEQRNKIRDHRREIESRRLEIEIIRENKNKKPLEKQVEEASHQTMIDSLESEVQQFQANIHSLREIRVKHKAVMRDVERVKEDKELIFSRLLTVSSLIERNVTAIEIRKMRITRELRAAMNEQSGPSGLQVASAEGEASGETEEKPETEEPEKETEDEKDSKGSSDDS